MTLKIDVKRIYEEPKKSDGVRVLVDRLWPRGVSKQKASIDVWAKELTPSPALRTWFHASPLVRYQRFSERYRAELSAPEANERRRALVKGQTHLTLLTAARDLEHSHVPTLVSFLKKRSLSQHLRVAEARPRQQRREPGTSRTLS